MKDSRRSYLQKIGIASTGIATVAHNAEVAEAADNPEDTQPVAEGLEYDLSVINSGSQKHKLTVRMRRLSDESVEYSQDFTLPGVNDEGDRPMHSYRATRKIQVPTDETYTVELSGDDIESETTEWFVPEEGLENQVCRINIIPQKGPRIITQVE